MHILCLRLFGARPINTQSATKEARSTQSGTCEGSHLARSQSRPFDAALMLLCSLQLAQKARTSKKMDESQLNSLALGALTLSLSLSPQGHGRTHILENGWLRTLAMGQRVGDKQA